MCDEAVDDCLAALTFIPGWFVTGKMIKNLFTALQAEDNIVYFNEDSGNFMFSSNKMGIVSIDLNNIDLYDTNYYEDDPETIIFFSSQVKLSTFISNKRGIYESPQELPNNLRIRISENQEKSRKPQNFIEL